MRENFMAQDLKELQVLVGVRMHRVSNTVQAKMFTQFWKGKNEVCFQNFTCMFFGGGWCVSKSRLTGLQDKGVNLVTQDTA